MNDRQSSNSRSPLLVPACFLLLLGIIICWLTQNGLTLRHPQALVSLFTVTAKALPALTSLWLAAGGLGFALTRLLFKQTQPPLAIQLALGMAVLLWVNWIIAALGLLHVITACAMLTISAALNLWRLRPTQNSPTHTPRQPLPWSLLLLPPGIALLWVAACCPPGTLWRVEAFAYDVTSYHLQLPREWLELGRMIGLTHNVYSFLPSLIENAYLLLARLHGSALNAIFPAQLFHASLALLAAGCCARAVAPFADRHAAIGTAALFLVVPWVTVTGSLAYNEMGMLAFGAAALALTFTHHGNTPIRHAVLIGLLLGAATLGKLTAGVMLAVPLSLILLFNLNRSTPTSPDSQHNSYNLKHGFQTTIVAAVVCLLTLSPYLIRNAVQTGNPVFPFAADTLGQGHWDDTLVQRWNNAHGLSRGQPDKLDALKRQWLLNTGYGALGGKPTPRETHNIARFNREGGVPVLWLSALIAVGFVLTDRKSRRPAAALLGLLIAQLAFWMFATHMQSRFLLPTLLPTVVLIGIGYHRLRTLLLTQAPTAAPLAGVAVIATLAVVNDTNLASQTRTVPDPDTGRPLPVPVGLIIGPPVTPADHPINRLPENTRTLLVADNASLLYLERPIVYASAFDAAPLGNLVRQTDGSPDAVNAALKNQGITHVWVHWAELRRLHATYGHDPDVTEQRLQQLIHSGWQTVETVPHTATLYALPSIQSGCASQHRNGRTISRGSQR